MLSYCSIYFTILCLDYGPYEQRTVLFLEPQEKFVLDDFHFYFIFLWNIATLIIN